MMISTIQLSDKSNHLLKIRGLSDQQVNDFSNLLNKAQEQLETTGSAKEVLSGLSTSELSLLQKATSLADPIRVSSLSDEGAINLLKQPDRSEMVDLNNDGLVEVGAAKTISFPPVNAPQHIHDAWEQATEGMDFKDKLVMELRMHIHIYGIRIHDQATKEALSPEQQWSYQGWQNLIGDARSALEFMVAREGWTEKNLRDKAFYDRFEQALSEHSS